MNPHRTCQENMDALKKVLTQRTLLALSDALPPQAFLQRNLD